MNSMASVCDWRGRTCFYNEYGVDEEGNLLEPSSSLHEPRPGLMAKLINIVERQLNVAYSENIHAMSATKPLSQWIDAIQIAYGRELQPDELEGWKMVIGQFYQPLDRDARRINETGFVLRLINWLQPRLQRQWYLKAYGKILTSDRAVSKNVGEFRDEFQCPALPRTMSSPIVPSLLPFNTVSALLLYLW
jgi:protein O-GlcNAc transferase